jgi:hypothetical protein
MTKFFSFLLLAILFFACKPEQIITTDPSAKITFSKDTVLFDTVFTTVGSVTKRFVIYNKNKNAINISSIHLTNENDFATYRLNADGIAGNNIADLEIKGNDSAFVFVEVTLKANATERPFLIEDSIQFTYNEQKVQVQLVSYGQNAHFYSDITWANDLPYVIYGGILVDSLSKLTIEPGVKIYLHKDAVMYAKGTIEMNGTATDSITLQGDRRESEYYNEPGQWSCVQFLPGSINNKISHTTIKNAVYGVVVGTYPVYGLQPNLQIENSIIKYSMATGIFGINAKINAYNNLVFACGQYAFFVQLGGDYDIVHNTFGQTNNFTNRQTAGVTLTDYLKYNSVVYTERLTFNLTNNIIWGNLRDELYINYKSPALPMYTLSNNLMRSSNSDYNSNNILNRDPLFANPSLTLAINENEDYHLKQTSPAIGFGQVLSGGPAIPYLFDMDGKIRSNPSTIGCYE